ILKYTYSVNTLRRAHTHMLILIHIHAYTHTHTHIHAQMHTHTHIHAHMHTHTHTHTDTHTHNNDFLYEVPTDAMVTPLSWARRERWCQKNAMVTFFLNHVAQKPLKLNK